MSFQMTSRFINKKNDFYGKIHYELFAKNDKEFHIWFLAKFRWWKMFVKSLKSSHLWVSKVWSFEISGSDSLVVKKNMRVFSTLILIDFILFWSSAEDGDSLSFDFELARDWPASEGAREFERDLIFREISSILARVSGWTSSKGHCDTSSIFSIGFVPSWMLFCRF